MAIASLSNRPLFRGRSWRPGPPCAPPFPPASGPSEVVWAGASTSVDVAAGGSSSEALGSVAPTPVFGDRVRFGGMTSGSITSCFGLLGLAFKPNTDDTRDSPATEVGRLLLHEGVQVKGYDPVAMPNAARLLPGLQLAEDPYDLAAGCDAIIVCTDWNEFKHLDMARVKDVMRQPFIVDGRNLYDPDRMKGMGFTYRGVGRGY